MPLRDHKVLIDKGRSWQGFHGGWACTILAKLNLEQLSQDYRAGLDVHKPLFALPTFEATPDHILSTVLPDRGFPPLPVMSAFAPVDEPRSTDVTVEYEGCQQLVSVVLFAHHGFTGSAHGRRAFAVKCAKWLQRGTSVVTVNVDSRADVHGDLVEVLQLPEGLVWRSPTGFAAVAYRPVSIKGELRVDVWPHVLDIGEPLPTVPLWLAADLAVPLELEPTYEATCKSLRVA